MRSRGPRRAGYSSQRLWRRSGSLIRPRNHAREATLQLCPALLFPLMMGVVERLMEPQRQRDHGETVSPWADVRESCLPGVLSHTCCARVLGAASTPPAPSSILFDHRLTPSRGTILRG